MTLIWDVAFIGRPADPSGARRWQTEVELVRASGRRVLVAETPDDLPPRVAAGLILIADPDLGGQVGDLPPDAQLVLRRAGAVTPSRIAALSAHLGRRVVAAPLGPAERQAWLRELPEHMVTAQDWPPLVDGAALALGAHRPIGEPWRIALAGPDGSAPPPLSPDDLAAALAHRGLGADVVEITTDRRDPRRPPHVLLCSDAPDPDTVCAAVEDGCVVAVARGALDPPRGRTTPIEETWDWDHVPETLADLLSTPARWRTAFLAMAARALDGHTDAPFLARIDSGTCGPALKPPGVAVFGPGAVPAVPGAVTDHTGTVEADLALIGDFRRRDEVTVQAAAQVRAHAASGRRVVLVQAWNGKPGGEIHPVIDAVVRRGQAQVLSPWARARVTCAQVLLPRLTIPALDLLRPAIVADRWVVTETESDAPRWDAATLHATLSRLYGTTPRWMASHPAARTALAARLPGPVGAWPLPVPPPSPRSGIAAAAGPDRPPRADRTIIGIVAYAAPEAEATLQAIGAMDAPAMPGGAEVHVLLAGPQRSLGGTLPDHVRVLALDGADTDGFVRLIDVLVIPPAVPFEHLPRLAAGLALARGVAVLAAPSLAPVLGPGPRYARPADWPARVADLRARSGPVARAPAALVLDDGPLAPALGLPPAPRPGTRGARSAPRVLFATANGVGLGHVTRLSAIARRLPDGVEPVFATMSQAVGVLQDMGFPCELLTGYSGKPAQAWRASLFHRMADLLDHHQPAALVLDSSNPYPGLMEAAVCRPDLRLIWVRRGMWRATQDYSEFLTRAPYFERVIEPRDIAEADGDSAVQDLSGHGRILRVPPIGLLDEDDLLDQGAARRALGLPETPPPGGSVLVQLGSGTTRDLNTLLGEVIAHLRGFDGLEIVLAQWLNTPTAYDARWPGVRLLSGYPIPRYYRAFDFTISAAGYNSYNDLLRFGIPTIFIANDAQMMDDQGARARHAERAEAAFNVPETDLGALSDCVGAILQPQVRQFLQDRARAIALPNGARAAADAVMELL